jgi:hypothetical protein
MMGKGKNGEKDKREEEKGSQVGKVREEGTRRGVEERGERREVGDGERGEKLEKGERGEEEEEKGVRGEEWAMGREEMSCSYGEKRGGRKGKRVGGGIRGKRR